MSDLDKSVDTVTITRLDNGYYVYSDTIRTGVEAHYCSNLRGVTKQLYRLLEGKERLSKDQIAGVKGAFTKVKETLEQEQTEEKDNA
ncbi:hypothetical protein LCGC14_1993450 [marine sediment metagenome]|uniref:Uncharacterized protein n=1 Tax=marine sediment metagenome TaxID=412755 RepID=A0A0F9HIR6_9ZZZZ